MKNVTIALDDEVHRLARIRAAELGTSLSALVKDYLNGLIAGGEPSAAGVREMQAPFEHAAASGGAPWPTDAKLKPRQPGSLRRKQEAGGVDDLETPEWLVDIMERWDEADFASIP